MRREGPTRRYTIFYWTYNSLNMFRATLCPSSGAWDYTDSHSMWRITLVMTRVEQHPSTRTHNLQPHTTPTTSHNQSYVPHATNICIVSSSWWWA